MLLKVHLFTRYRRRKLTSDEVSYLVVGERVVMATGGRNLFDVTQGLVEVNKSQPNRIIPNKGLLYLFKRVKATTFAIYRSGLDASGCNKVFLVPQSFYGIQITFSSF